MSKYQGRKFLGIDGERAGGLYVLLADSTGASVENPEGLTSAECLAFLTRQLPRAASWTRVGYGLHLDLNHWISDFPEDERIKILSGDVGKLGAYSVQYVGNRIITIWDWPNDRKVTIYDALGMFRKPFVDTVTSWCGECPEIIREGKARRASFTLFDLPFMRQYNQAECTALVDVLTRVRAYLAELPGGGVDLRGWYGAGAIASSWLRRAGARRLMRRFDLRYVGGDLLDAFARAYHGGRVEARMVGTVGPVWRYDINSAYAWAACHMGRVTYNWVPVEAFNEDAAHKMSVYLVQWQLPSGSQLGPFPVRDEQGNITYPLAGQGWYWWPEVRAARQIYGGRRIRVAHGYWCPDGRKPIGHAGKGIGLATVLKVMYQYRHWSREKSPHGARLLKLALAAVWGKFAQRHSAQDNGDEPGYFYCQPWAGWITSCVRAAILTATAGNQDAVISIATDGIVTSRELPKLRISDDLGGWRVEQYRAGTFLLPGLFRLEGYDGQDEVERTRGFERAAVDWDGIIDQLNESHVATIKTERFIGHLLPDLYPERMGKYRLKFVTVPIRILPAAISAKRLGGDELRDGFDYRHDRAWIGAHPGDADYLGFGIGVDTPQEDAEKRAYADGEMDARI